MFRYYFNHFQVLYGNPLVAGLTCHTRTFEHACGIRTCTDRTGSTQTVVLAVGSLAYTAKPVAFYNTLIPLTR